MLRPKGYELSPRASHGDKMICDDRWSLGFLFTVWFTIKELALSAEANLGANTVTLSVCLIDIYGPSADGVLLYSS